MKHSNFFDICITLKPTTLSQNTCGEHSVPFRRLFIPNTHLYFVGEQSGHCHSSHSNYRGLTTDNTQTLGVHLAWVSTQSTVSLFR